MALPDRRTFLGCIGAGMIAGTASASHSHTRPQRATPGAGAADLEALVALVRRTPRRELLTKVTELHRSGTDWRDLLGAAFLAGIRDVEPRPVGFQFHCVMMTSSAFDIAARVPAAGRLATALYNLDDFKLSQNRDQRGGDWSQAAPPIVEVTDTGKATATLTNALEQWDLGAADHAATALAQCASLDQAFEPLWAFGLRNFTNIGHHPIFAAQAHRTLQHIGWRHGTEVLRSLAYGLLEGEAGAADQTFFANREHARRLELPRAGAVAPAAMMDLVVTLRRGTPDAAATAAAEALGDGMSLASLWDALRLFAAEQQWRAPGLLSAHSMTSVNALRYIAERSNQTEMRAMAVLQAVSWQVLYRDFLSGRGGYDTDAPALETLQPEDAATDAGVVFEAAGDDARAAAPLALAAAKNDTTALTTSARHWLLRKVQEHHDYKFAAALLEEMERATPDTAARMFAASLGYLRKPSDRDHVLWAHVTGG